MLYRPYSGRGKFVSIIDSSTARRRDEDASDANSAGIAILGRGREARGRREGGKVSVWQCSVLSAALCSVVCVHRAVLKD